ncbi:MAG: histidine phosphatase family protein [Eubacterium sp.]|nr:histidine phosphatase family protein [Eubacterium sp.]
MKIFLIRHGKTPQGEKQQYQGVLDTSLSEGGRAALKKADHTPDRVYVSPLKRAKETAEILFPGADLRVAEGLSEMNFGEFEGRSWREMEHDAAYRAWVDGNCEGRCPGGEDRAGFSDRVCSAFRELTEQALRDGLEQIAVVAHGGTQMAVLEKWAGSDRQYWEWQTACGCGWALDTACWPENLQVEGNVRYTVQEES